MKLKELLDLYDFERYDKDCPDERLKMNSRTVRIYLGNSTLLNSYFEIGRSEDNFPRRDIMHLGDVIKTDILDRKVERFYADETLGILFVFLKMEAEDDD